MLDWLAAGLIIGGLMFILFIIFYVLFAVWDSWRGR